LGIEWPIADPIVSIKDANAPFFNHAELPPPRA
jgi:dTDP-4-dehydrorhamnose 3,5-epimerase-like enzyme